MQGLSNIKILLNADIPFSGVTEDGDHVLAWSKFLGYLLRGEYIGPCGNSHQEPLFLGDLLGRLIGLVIGHSHHAIDNGSVQHFRNESRADALNLMWSWLSTG